MKNLFLLALASFVFASVSAQTKPPIQPEIKAQAQAQVKDTTKYPIGTYIFVVNVESGIDLMRGLQLTDYSKTKTDRLMQVLSEQMKTQEESWRAQQLAKPQDTTKHK